MTFSNAKQRSTATTHVCTLGGLMGGLKLAIGISMASLLTVASGACPLSAAAAPMGQRLALLQFDRGLTPNASSLSLADQVATQGAQAFEQGDRDLAFEQWQRALLLYRVAGDRAGEGHMFENLSVISQMNHHAAEAVNFGEQAIALYQALGDEKQHPSLYLNLGSAYRLARQNNEAIATYEQGLAIYQRNQDLVGERLILSLLAQTHIDAENYAQSMALNQQALEIAQRTGDASAQAEALSALGLAHMMTHQPAEALSAYQQALEIAQTLSVPEQEAQLLANIETAYRNLAALLQSQNRDEEADHILSLI